MIFGFQKHRNVTLGFAVLVSGLLAILPARCATPKYKDGEKKSPVIFSVPSGAYVTNIFLKLAPAAGNATIRYTLDGSEPDEDSPAFVAPLQITNTTLVRARAFPRSAPPSLAVSQAYTMLDGDLASFSSNLPLVILNSFGTNISHEQRIEGALQVMDGGKERTRLTGVVDFSGRCLVNIRGRASLRYPKSSFTVKTIDGVGDPASVSILGFPADSDWVLYAPYPDKTLMRDVLAYELHARMGHWVARTKFVEVFVSRPGAKLNQRDYAGVYVFEERIKRGDDRVRIEKLKAEDDTEPRVTGGYIFKKDHIDQGGGPMGGEGFGAGPTSQSTRAGYPTAPGGFPGDPAGFLPPARVTRSTSSGSSSSRRSTTRAVVTNHFGFAANQDFSGNDRGSFARDDFDDFARNEESFRTSHTNEFYFVEPEPDEITAVQKAWLKNHLREFEAALYGKDFMDGGKGYSAYIDADSFIDYHLITEMTKNVDGFRFSVFFHKDRGGKIKADPIWDWNLSFGNANGKQGWMPEDRLWPQLDDREYSWYRRLFDDPDFGQRYVDRWTQLRTNVFATEQILARIDELAALLQEAQKRNFEKWPILGRPINPNYFVGSSYEEEVAWMKKFIQARLEWMDKQFPVAPKMTVTSGADPKATFVVFAGEIYFTIDGSDPRASGGEVAKTAQTYKGPLPLGPGAKLFARVRQDNRWSGALVMPQ